MARIAAVAPLMILLVNLPVAAETPAAQLLSDAANQASLVKSDLDTIDFFGSSAGGWQSHSTIVAAYREHIGALRGFTAKLDSARANASSAQRTAIDRIVPLTRDFAAAAVAMLDALDNNPARLTGDDYKQYVKLNSDLAGELVTVIGAWVNYAKTGDELARVAEKIGVAAPLLR